MFAVQSTNQDIKGRGEEQTKESYTDHAEEYGNPIACRISEPAPVEVTSGTTPIINAIEVIKIGRKRRRLASTAALKAVAPCISSSRANSTIKMAFYRLARPVPLDRFE